MDVNELLNNLTNKVDQLLNDSYVFDELCRIIDLKIMSGEQIIELRGLTSIIRNLRSNNRPVAKLYNTGYNLKQKERKLILRALTKTNGNQRAAAELLGTSPRVLNHKIHTIHKISEFQWKKNKGIRNE